MDQRSQKVWKGIIERDIVLEMHEQDTVTTFGIRQTEKPRSTHAVGKENKPRCTAKGKT